MTMREVDIPKSDYRGKERLFGELSIGFNSRTFIEQRIFSRCSVSSQDKKITEAETCLMGTWDHHKGTSLVKGPREAEKYYVQESSCK